MKYMITYTQCVTEIVDARDIDQAARVACAIVLGLPKDSVRVLRIDNVTPPQLAGPAV